MLVRFQLKNHLSFNEKVEFSMVKGKVRKHKNHIIPTGYKDVNLLKAGIVYGANAAGKSNLVQAMKFAREQIINSHSVKHGQNIPTTPFKLEPQRLTEPSLFEFTILIDETIYVYGFELTREAIVSEWLYERQKNGKHIQRFERTNDQETGTAIVDFGSYQSTSDESLKRLHYCAETTGKNKLFLSNTIDDRFTDFLPIYKWFEDRIAFVFPTDRLASMGVSGTDEEVLSNFMNLLNQFDTGITNLFLVDVELDLLEVPKPLLKDIELALTENPNQREWVRKLPNDWYIFKKEDDQIHVQQLMTEHESADGVLVPFELDEESDGTLRILNLIPVLLVLIQLECIFVIDEIDRSLHPNLSEKIIEIFLSQPTKSQLIVTTHESKLLDLDLLRRDEIWFVEKDHAGASTAYSLEAFEPRYDKDIRTAYLSGRFGGVANLAPKQAVAG